MQEAFGYVLFGVVIVGGLIACVTFFLAPALYKEIGKGGLFEDDAPAARRGAAPATSGAVYDEEIRQLLSARNELRGRHGGAVVDVETELAALTRGPVDPELEAEVRAFVVSRNERLMARGKPPLDVDAEVARRLHDVSG